MCAMPAHREGPSYLSSCPGSCSRTLRGLRGEGAVGTVVSKRAPKGIGAGEGHKQKMLSKLSSPDERPWLLGLCWVSKISSTAWEQLSSPQRALGSGNGPFPEGGRIQDEQRCCCRGDGVSQLCLAAPAPAPALGQSRTPLQCIPAPSPAPRAEETLPSHSLLRTGFVRLSRVTGSRESSLISQGWKLKLHLP